MHLFLLRWSYHQHSTVVENELLFKVQAALRYVTKKRERSNKCKAIHCLSCQAIAIILNCVVANILDLYLDPLFTCSLCGGRSKCRGNGERCGGRGNTGSAVGARMGSGNAGVCGGAPRLFVSHWYAADAAGDVGDVSGSCPLFTCFLQRARRLLNHTCTLASDKRVRCAISSRV